MKPFRFFCLAAIACLVALPIVVLIAMCPLPSVPENLAGISLFLVLPLLLTSAILCVIHESAHLVVTLALGWKVRRVVIGSGFVVWQFALAAIPVEIRAIPFTGMVFFEPEANGWARLKFVLICLAGPASEYLLLAIMVYALGLDGPFSPHVLLIFAPLILIHATANLVPFSVNFPGYGPISSDGLNIIRALWLGRVPQALSEVAAGTRYPPEAFEFVRRTLTLASTGRAREAGITHVSGPELCWALRDAAIEAFGTQARAVLASWAIYSCEDFGQIVFAMVDAGLLKKSAQDSVQDFSGVFDFDAVFHEAGAIAQ